ncbi:uncharacterized protein LOC135397998 [Ornithodoros turicata]|uniref:uncharacterized protein LOC135397998 n=1 Tax=Ornithodoros turicata TaxID=34597 RepID=UPI003139F132
MEQLQTLRAPLRSCVQKLVDDITASLQETAPSKTKIQLKLASLTKKSSLLSDLDHNIAALIDDDEIESEAESCDNYLELITRVTLNAKRYVSTNHDLTTNPSPASTTSRNTSQHVSLLASSFTEAPTRKHPDYEPLTPEVQDALIDNDHPEYTDMKVQMIEANPSTNSTSTRGTIKRNLNDIFWTTIPQPTRFKGIQLRKAEMPPDSSVCPMTLKSDRDRNLSTGKSSTPLNRPVPQSLLLQDMPPPSTDKSSGLPMLIPAPPPLKQDPLHPLYATDRESSPCNIYCNRYRSPANARTTPFRPRYQKPSPRQYRCYCHKKLYHLANHRLRLTHAPHGV